LEGEGASEGRKALRQATQKLTSPRCPDSIRRVPTVAELKRYAATPLCRYESRIAAGGRSRIMIYGLGLALDAAAFWVFAGTAARAVEGGPEAIDGYGDAYGGWALLILALLAVLPTLWSIGLSASAIAGERENGTFEALLLTPLDRRTLLWAKLLGRTAAPRRFMLATAPAYLCSAATVSVYLLADSGRRESSWPWFWPVMALYVLLAALAVALIWGILFYQMHAVAAVGLWFSSKYQRTWTASVLTYLAVIGPTVLLCGCGTIISLAWPMVLGPALFDELVWKFDARALGPDGLG
jgi:hypothetical protein